MALPNMLQHIEQPIKPVGFLGVSESFHGNECAASEEKSPETES